MTNNRSTGVAARVNLTVIGTVRRLLGNETLRRGIFMPVVQRSTRFDVKRWRMQ